MRIRFSDVFMAIVSVMILVPPALVIILPACHTPQSNSGQSAEQATREYQAAHAVPDWLLNSLDDANAFYGVGIGSYRGVTHAQLGITSAELAARRQLADTLETTIQAVTQRYMEQVVTPDGHVVEESLVRDVMRSVTDNVVRGVQIVKRSIARDRETGVYVVYALAKIGGEAVAEQIRDQVALQVGQVRARAEAAFQNLDDIIREERAAAAQAEPEYAPNVPAGARDVSNHEPTQG